MRKIKFMVLAIIFFLDVANLVSDWLLYHDITTIEDGLVYGPINKATHKAQLAFSIIGSFTMLLEVVSLIYKIRRANSCIDVELLAVFTVWFEDFPLTIINLIIVACREDPVSYFQLIKASFILGAAVFRLIVTCILCHSKEAKEDLKEHPDSKLHKVYRSLVGVGLVLCTIGAIVIFIFSQVNVGDGSVSFKKPRSLTDDKYDDERYFNNVSVYFRHTQFNDGMAEEPGLLRLLTINEIRTQKDQSIRIRNCDSGNCVDGIYVIMGGKTECFQTKATYQTLNLLSDCAAVKNAATSEIIITFKFIEPNGRKLIFGDIKYNIKVKDLSTNTCASPDFSVDNDLSQHKQDKKVAVLHYFKIKSNIDGQHHVRHTSPNKTALFYRSSDLEDISTVWRTGFLDCECTGSLAPHRDESITVPC